MEPDLFHHMQFKAYYTESEYTLWILIFPHCALTVSTVESELKLTACLFELMFYVSVNSYGNVGMVSSPSHTFYLGKLD